MNQFADAGWIDEIQLLMQPVALSEGTPVLKGIKDTLTFELSNSRIFETGNALLCYQPAKAS
ncbi:MAG TPA: hypothetical protein VGN90_10315 [Pyrinomonadaceae bacterium]|nr:hypothetical protein [Pyrinomonadaceae bacterium]